MGIILRNWEGRVCGNARQEANKSTDFDDRFYVSYKHADLRLIEKASRQLAEAVNGSSFRS